MSKLSRQVNVYIYHVPQQIWKLDDCSIETQVVLCSNGGLLDSECEYNPTLARQGGDREINSMD